MNTVCSTFLASIVLIAPAALSAQTVYQNTNEQGVVEFSDQPSEGASTRTVNPNVVDISSTPQSSTSQQPAKQQTAATPAPAPATTTEHTTVYTNNNNALRKKHRVEAHKPGKPGPTPR